MVVKVYISGISGNKEVRLILENSWDGRVLFSTFSKLIHVIIVFDYVSYDTFQVKKRQQRVLMILDSKNIKYDVIDITEPGKESDKEFMQNNSKANGGTVSDPNPRSPLPPQIFNDEEYCGVSSIISCKLDIIIVYQVQAHKCFGIFGMLPSVSILFLCFMFVYCLCLCL